MSKLNTDLLRAVAAAHTALPVRASSVRPARASASWTSEQLQFLDSQAPRMLLTALAGSGKSSVLLEYARRRPHQSWNLLAFNTHVVQDLSVKAPPNMRVQTAHQLAFSKCGHDIQHKLNTPVTSEALRARWPDGNQPGMDIYAETVLSALTAYCHSSDATPALCHRDPDLWSSLLSTYSGQSWTDADWLDRLMAVWSWSLSPTDNWGAQHDVYLKRFCLMSEPWPSTFWMLDETQDWSEAFLDAWSRCTPISIRTGDPFQRLYAWRGAFAGTWKEPHEHEWWLTQSWRTGSGMEQWINRHLSALGSPKLWLPAPHVCSVSTAAQTPEEIKVFRPDVVLAGTWAVLQAVAPTLRAAGFSVRWWPKADPAAGRTDDVTSGPPIILSTIHAAKGLEWDRVWVADHALPVHETPTQRHRMAYVAATRARTACRLPGGGLPPLSGAHDLLAAFD